MIEPWWARGLQGEDTGTPGLEQRGPPPGMLGLRSALLVVAVRVRVATRVRVGVTLQVRLAVTI